MFVRVLVNNIVFFLMCLFLGLEGTVVFYCFCFFSCQVGVGFLFILLGRGRFSVFVLYAFVVWFACRLYVGEGLELKGILLCFLFICFIFFSLRFFISKFVRLFFGGCVLGLYKVWYSVSDFFFFCRVFEGQRLWVLFRIGRYLFFYRVLECRSWKGFGSLVSLVFVYRQGIGL